MPLRRCVIPESSLSRGTREGVLRRRKRQLGESGEPRALGGRVDGRLTAELPATQTLLVAGLRELTADVESALERVRVPAYVVDGDGIVRWVNPAAERLFGDVRGRHMTSALAPEERRRGLELFARNLLGPPEGSDNRAVLLDAEGERFTAELSGVPLSSGGHVIGVFGQVKDVEETQPPPPPHPKLTPRQSDVLRLLEQGRSTKQIASELHLSTDTVRNHVRGLLQTLGVHTRLEAVAVAHRDRLRAS